MLLSCCIYCKVEDIEDAKEFMQILKGIIVYYPQAQINAKAMEVLEDSIKFNNQEKRKQKK